MSVEQGPFTMEGEGEVTLGPIVEAEWELLIRLVTDHVAGTTSSPPDMHFYVGRDTLLEKLELWRWASTHVAVTPPEIKIGGTD